MADTQAASPHGIKRAEGAGRKPVKKEIESLRIKFGANGGHAIIHDYKRPEQKGDRYIPAPDSDEFLFGATEGKQAMAHIAKHMNIAVAGTGGGEPDEGED